MVLAWENFRRFLWCWPSLCCCCCSSFIFIRRCFSFCWCCIFICFSDPWRSPPALSSTPTTFDCLFFFIYRERYGLSGHFLPYTPSAFIKVSLGVGSYFLGSCRASYWSSKHRPGPPVCLIHSYLKSVSMHVNIAKVLLVMKTLIRSAATLFSNHEKTKQQPN